MKHHIFYSRFYFFFLIFLFIILFISCNKNEEIGFETQPQQNSLHVIFEKSISIFAYSVLEDSVRTDKTILNLIGSYKDPVFGITTAGMYTQFRLTTTSVNFGNNPICDSIILSLAYTKEFYGDTSSLLTLNVFELNEDFYSDKPYYSNNRLATFKKNLANYSFTPNLVDSVNVGTSMVGPHLRVRLNNTLGQKILNASTSDLIDNSTFLKFFKGLYISTNKVNTNGSILYINSLSTISKLALYYHNTTDTLTYNFVLNDNCARFNTFNHHNYKDAISSFKQQTNGDTSLGDYTLFLQAMAGTKIRLKFPDVINLSTIGKIAINRAELVLKIDLGTETGFSPPDNLSLVVINKDNSLSFLPDIAYGEAYFGGKYNSSTNEYRFNISKYIQNALQNGSFEDNGLYIVISGAAIKGNRAIIKGSKCPDDNMRLEIIYTIIQ